MNLRVIKVLGFGIILVLLSPVITVIAMIAALFKAESFEFSEKKLAKEHSSELEELAHRMAVLYSEIPYSDILMIERIANTLREKGYGKTYS